MIKKDDDNTPPIQPNTHTGFGNSSWRATIPTIASDFSTVSDGIAIPSAAIGTAMSVTP